MLRSVLGKLLLMTVPSALLLGSMELTAALLGYEPIHETRTLENLNFIRTCRWGPDHVERRCLREVPLPANAVDVFMYGGSSVFGHPFGEQRTMTLYLQGYLNGTDSGAFNVQNYGRVCKDSIFVEQCVQTTEYAKPEVLVVYSGHNDFSGFMGRFPQIYHWFERHGWWMVEWEKYVQATRTFAMLRDSTGQKGMMQAQKTHGMSKSQVDYANQVILAEYEANITKVIETAAARSATVILVTVVGNLYEYPYRRPVWDKVLDRAEQGDQGAGLQNFAEGIRRYRSGEHEEALEYLKTSRDENPHSRAPGILNYRLREIASRYDHVHLVDFETELDRTGMREGIGCNYFGTDKYCDGVHPNPRTNKMIGHAVGRKIEQLYKAGKITPGPDGTRPPAPPPQASSLLKNSGPSRVR